ncbi:hypothetical protein C8Q75DRAFT_730862 [Abortiporus biennis]|nr:hypothetical protein C8Q75DRAFT_730862 [Abortiporus biennis]
MSLKDCIMERYGERFNVEDIGMSQYTHDLEFAPLEFAVVDTRYPKGIPPGEVVDEDSPYHPHVLSANLREAGFDAINLRKPIQESLLAEEYSCFPAKSSRAYPLQLEVHSPRLFTIRTPGPTITRLVSLLKAYTTSSRSLRDLIAFWYILIRSAGIQDLSPTCAALMAIQSCQMHGAAPNLQRSAQEYLWDGGDLTERPDAVWVPKYQPFRKDNSETPGLELVDTYFDAPKTVEQTKSENLYELLRTYDSFSYSTLVVSIRSGKHIKRELSFRTILHDNKEVTPPVAKPDSWRISKSKNQPQSWPFQPLVVEDPFIRSYNHAEGVSFNSWCYILQHINARQTMLARLNLEALDFYNNNRPFEHEMEARKMTIQGLNDVVQRISPHLSVRTFGSTSYGVDAPKSDLDVVILDDERPLGPKPDDPSYPTAKIVDKITGITCDININGRTGIRNTSMIVRYTSLAPAVLRPVIFALKQWIKYVDLNDTSRYTFASYSLVLMTIGYLQTKGYLPNLQDPKIAPARYKDTVYFGQKDPIRCNAAFNDTLQRSDFSLPPIDIGHTLIGWLKYWAYEFPYDTHVMDIRRGGQVPRTKPFTREDWHDMHFPRPDFVTGTVPPVNPPGRETKAVRKDRIFSYWTYNKKSHLFRKDPFDWTIDPLVLVDPFIIKKNLALKMPVDDVQRFRWECDYVLYKLRLGQSLEEAMGLTSQDSTSKVQNSAEKSSVSFDSEDPYQF